MDISLELFDKKLGNKIRQLRILNGMSQQDVADLLGVTFQQVQKYEKGANRITVKTLYVLIRYMNISFAEVMKDIWDEDEVANTSNQKQVNMIRAFNQLSKSQVNILLDIIAAFGCVNNRQVQEVEWQG